MCIHKHRVDLAYRAQKIYYENTPAMYTYPHLYSVPQYCGVTPHAWDYDRKAYRWNFPYLHTGRGDTSPSADTLRVNLAFRDTL